MEKKVRGIAELREVAREFLEQISPRDTAVVVGLVGELGAGKTTFVKQIAHILGVDSSITSPTYVILKKYPIPDYTFNNLIHIDAYRIESAEELQRLKWEELLKDPQNLIFLEWPRNVSEILPEDWMEIRLAVTGNSTRDITMDMS